MEKNTYEEIEIDFRDLLFMLRSRIWIIIISGIITAMAAGFVSSYIMTPVYTSNAQLYILSKTTSITSLADIQIGTQLTQDFMVLIKSRPVVNQVIENLNLNMSYETLVKKISVSNPSNTRILVITVSHPNAYMAKKIVDEFAYVSADQIAKIMHTEAPSIIEEGEIAQEPSEPNIKRNIIVGGILGVFLSAAIVILVYVMDDTLKDSDDIEKYLGLSTLGMIPMDAESRYALKEKYMPKGKKQVKKRGKL